MKQKADKTKRLGEGENLPRRGKKMAALKNWLKRNGFDYREVMTTEGTAGVMISTNYIGEHPKKETTA